MADVVDKYFNKKKKQIYDYCKILNDFISFDSTKTWKNESELAEYLKKIISMFVDKYYFDSMENFDDYAELLELLLKSDNKFKTIFVCSIESIPEEYRNINSKISIYILSLIVYTSVTLNRFTYPYNHYKITMKNVTSIVEPLLNSNSSIIKYKYNAKKMKELTAKIRKNDSLESRFFDSLNDLSNESSKNIYESFDETNKYYKVSYKYSIPELGNYKSKESEKYLKRIEDEFNCFSYELATVASLKSKMLEKDLLFLFPINLSFYEKNSEINKLFEILKNEDIKKSIYFLIEYDDYKKHTGVVRMIANYGFKLAIKIDGSTEIPYGTFTEIKLAFIDKEFLEINKGNIETWKNSEVKFVIKRNSESISELEMLEIEEVK